MSSGERYLGAATTSPDPRPMTRIEASTENIKSLTSRVRRITDTNIDHAHQLGFYPATPEPPKSGTAINPVVANIEAAIRELTEAVDNLDASMSLFH